MDDVRPSPIAGRWYPREAGALRQVVDDYLAAAPPLAQPIAADVVGLLAPHAGLMYSGPVAACAFGAVRGASVEVVALVCPSHFHDDGPVLTSGHQAYATPLGVVPVDAAGLAVVRTALAAELGGPPEQLLVAIREDQEHAIEIELPFLQRVLAGGFSLLPIMLRDQSAGRCWWPAPICRIIFRSRGPNRWMPRCCARWRPWTRPVCWPRRPAAAGGPAGRARLLPCCGRRARGAPTRRGWCVTPPRAM